MWTQVEDRGQRMQEDYRLDFGVAQACEPDVTAFCAAEKVPRPFCCKLCSTPSLVHACPGRWAGPSTPLQRCLGSAGARMHACMHAGPLLLLASLG